MKSLLCLFAVLPPTPVLLQTLSTLDVYWVHCWFTAFVEAHLYPHPGNVLVLEPPPPNSSFAEFSLQLLNFWKLSSVALLTLSQYTDTQSQLTSASAFDLGSENAWTTGKCTNFANWSQLLHSHLMRSGRRLIRSECLVPLVVVSALCLAVISPHCEKGLKCMLLALDCGLCVGFLYISAAGVAQSRLNFQFLLRGTESFQCDLFSRFSEASSWLCACIFCHACRW